MIEEDINIMCRNEEHYNNVTKYLRTQGFSWFWVPSSNLKYNSNYSVIAVSCSERTMLKLATNDTVKYTDIDFLLPTSIKETHITVRVNQCDHKLTVTNAVVLVNDLLKNLGRNATTGELVKVRANIKWFQYM